MSGVLVEAAVETLTAALRAERDGAGRLELCADLARDGTTPSAGLVRLVRARVDLPLHVLIRPRPGDFHYTRDELAIMVEDIRECRRAGADGVVLGALARDRTVDRAAMGRLLTAARPLGVTFHRAVDATPDYGAALALLLELGVDRVLTAGGAPTALDGAERLATAHRSFGGAMRIMAGGKVRSENVVELLRRTGVREVHVGLPWGGPEDRIAGIVTALRAG